MWARRQYGKLKEAKASKATLTPYANIMNAARKEIGLTNFDLNRGSKKKKKSIQPSSVLNRGKLSLTVSGAQLKTISLQKEKRFTSNVY